MKLEKSNKKKYIEEHRRTLKIIEENDIDQVLNSDIIAQNELDKKISQYGILGKNLKNLNIEEKEKFANYIEKEIWIKKKISENYNTEYFVEQERLALQRKLKYEVLLEIEKLTKIANTKKNQNNFLNFNKSDQKITSTIILNRKNSIGSDFKIKENSFEERKLKIQKRINEIKDEWAKK